MLGASTGFGGGLEWSPANLGVSGGRFRGVGEELGVLGWFGVGFRGDLGGFGVYLGGLGGSRGV